MNRKITPKRRRTILKPKNSAAWIEAFTRRDPLMSGQSDLSSPPISLETMVSRYLEDVKAEDLHLDPRAMEILRKELRAALLKVWDIPVGEDGMIHNTTLLPFEMKGGKAWFTVPSATVLNMGSGFVHKDLCTAGTLTAGSACVFSCFYCSVGSSMFRSPQTRILRLLRIDHRNAVIRRLDPVNTLRNQLTFRDGAPRYLDPDDRRVVIISPIVDPLARLKLMEETLKLIKLVMELTNWDVRVLTKSMYVRNLAELIPTEYRHRIIYGLSLGIIDDNIAKVVELKTSLPTTRLKVYRELQEQGLRTYSMHCPILPQKDYKAYAQRLADSTNWDQDELVWAEALNSRGDSNKATINALRAAGFSEEATLLAEATSSHTAWEFCYNRPLFEALAAVCPPGKLRYLVYAGEQDRDYWLGCRDRGAVVLGKDKPLEIE